MVLKKTRKNFTKKRIRQGEEKKMTKEGLLKVMSLAKEDRMAGKQVLIVNMKKNKKFQKEQLTEDGYTEIVDCYADSVENL